ncbi:hypothetical protein ACFFX0_26605 [Citricoccus parietis]|uniref:Uncharacterized protein n=1 Tax=Citricoccus parietis TaxID=592307 RepID=A0ABV5G6J7_9MICC
MAWPMDRRAACRSRPTPGSPSTAASTTWTVCAMSPLTRASTSVWTRRTWRSSSCGDPLIRPPAHCTERSCPVAP